MIDTPAILFSSGRLSKRNVPSAVAPSPSRMKISENVPTNTRLRPTTAGSKRRAPRARGSTPETVAR